MDERPDIACLVVTYERRDILHGTLVALLEHLRYAAPLRLVIADDGSTDGTQEMIATEFPTAEVIQSHRAGMGGNTNAGLRACFAATPLVLQIQDDMQLKADLDLTPHADRLLSDETAGYVRLWGVGGHKLHAKLEESHWRVLWSSPDLYIASDRPHLKHHRFHDFYGYYPEGLRTAETEEAWCHQCKDRSGNIGLRPDVLVPHSLEIERLWEHMGWHCRWREVGL